MVKRRGWRNVILALERLELREVPAVAASLETFEQAALGALPLDWLQHSTDGSNGFRVASTRALGSEAGLRSDGTSTTASRTWLNTPAPADVTVSASIYLDRLIPAQVFARGQGVDSSAPSYYAASIKRGLQVQLARVENGRTTILGSLSSAEWISNKWVRLSLTTVGNTLRVQLFRTDTGQYLNAAGRWQFTRVDALTVQDSGITAGGFAGLGRAAQYAGTVNFDNFQIAPPESNDGRQTLTEESFARPLSGGLPAQWVQWSGGRTGFQVSTARTMTGSGALTIATTTTDAVRTWVHAPMPADVEVSAAIYLNSLVPGQIIARGRDLNSTTPTYYAVSVMRGLELQLLKVVDGQTSVLATLDSQEWISGKWVQVTFALRGDELRALVYRFDSAKYLTESGTWQETPTWAVARQDGAIAAGGYSGLGRAGGAGGSVTFDNFSITQLSAAPRSTSGLPAGWTQWSNNGSIGFEESTAISLTPPTSIVSNGASDLEARAWLDAAQPADVQVSAALYLDSLVPAQILLRGRNLDGAAPSYYAAVLERGLQLQIVRVVNGQTTVLGTMNSNPWDSGRWMRVNFTAQDQTLQAQVIRVDTGEYLNEDGDWQAEPAAAMVRYDPVLTEGGAVGLGRQASYSGRLVFDDVEAGALSGAPPAVDPPASSPDPIVSDTPPSNHPPQPPAPSPAEEPAASPGQALLPDVPRHYSHIRIAQLAYHGTPLGKFEENLLRHSVDLVIPNTGYLGRIDAIAPNTPQFIYSNASNIYRELLTDWLAYADRKGYSREAAFYHVTKPTEFTGDSASSTPVNRFWEVRVGRDGSWRNRTTNAYTSEGSVRFGGSGDSVALGYIERFREINFAMVSGAGGGWSGRLEYASAVDATGNPTVWKPLPLLSDGTGGFRITGRVTFDPPADWTPASIGGPDLHYFVRVRTLTGGTEPVAATILGRDYVNANGRPAGVIPVFDKAADLDGDGYLNDAEFARRAAGKDARFYYESRAFYPAYGQHRYATNIAHRQYQEWAADFSHRYLAANPEASGLFMDNSLSKIAFDPATIEESLAQYADHYAALLAGVNARIAPKWVLVNIAGGGTAVDALAKRGISYLDEFALRPMSASYSQFEDVADNLQRRLSLSQGKVYAVLDSLAPNGSMTDPRMQIGTLAYYYLLAHPAQTMLMFNGGNEPNTSWTRHWSPAVEFNVGVPRGDWSVFVNGRDPANTSMIYKVYQRTYDRAWVLYKPLSYHLGRAGTTGEDTATVHQLGGSYRPLQADGTLGAAVTSIRLRNGEGAILVRA